jgi:DNA-binding NarL/FixJ family response regulator
MAEQTEQEKDQEKIKARYEAINKLKINDEEKETLRLYDQGVQNFDIAKRVYKFVNHDTVGTVLRTIRKAHATDFDEAEKINDYKGYTGV